MVKEACMEEDKQMEMMDMIDKAVDAYRSVLGMRMKLETADDKASKTFSKELSRVETQLLDVICFLHREESET